MMNKNVVIGLVGAVAVLLAVVAVRQQDELRKARAATEEAQGQAQAAEAKTVAATAAARAVRTEKAAVRQHPPLSDAKAVEQAASPGTVPESRSVTVTPGSTNDAAPMAGLAKMMKNPAMKSMIRSQQQGQLDLMYGALFKGLALTPEDQDAFKALLLDKQMALMDAAMGMMDGSGTPEQRKVQAETIVEMTKDYDAKVQALLGDDNYALYKQYEDTQPERVQVNLYKQSLTGADQLSEQQEHDLIRALYDSRKDDPEAAKQLDKSKTPDPSTFTEAAMTSQLAAMARMQEKYLAQAATVLTPSQLAEFKKSQENMRAMQEMGMKMAAQMFGVKQGSGVSPHNNRQ